jgi:hypothetical protein
MVTAASASINVVVLTASRPATAAALACTAGVTASILQNSVVCTL